MTSDRLLMNLIKQNELQDAPTKRVFYGEWVEVVVSIGPDYCAYITMPGEAYDELVRRVG